MLIIVPNNNGLFDFPYQLLKVGLFKKTVQVAAEIKSDFKSLNSRHLTNEISFRMYFSSSFLVVNMFFTAQQDY